MNDSKVRLSGYHRLKKLRTALAIARGTVLLADLKREAEGTISHDQTKRVTYLTNLFSRIHRELFQDWKDQATIRHRPGTMTDADKRLKFRKTIGRLVLDEEANRDTAIFDNNGFVINADNIDKRLADFYLKMRIVRPFDYGNRITLDFFMTILGRLPAFKAVYEHGIDFRRIDQHDAIALHDTSSNIEALTRAFHHSLDPLRNQSLINQANGYGIWPENKTFVSGIPFLSYVTENGTQCLVSVNGGLVPLDSIQEELFTAGKHIADYPLCSPDNIVGYLPGTEALRTTEKTEIDGITVGKQGEAPLFCLDVNMLTGLRSPSHAELLELVKQCAGNQASIFNLADNEALKQQLLIAANGDERLQRSVEIAYVRLAKIVRILKHAEDDIFFGKKPVEEPRLFMSMGGAGSGKSVVEEIATNHCGDNFVIASLDEFRKQSDLYKVLTAANHHSDDYVYVEPFANRLRDEVARRAKLERINILYDGTGIPYSPRYSGIINEFKQAGFYTQITAVDAFIVKPGNREHELIRSTVIDSVKQRFEKTGRALPWVITVYKHIRSPESFLDALEDPALNKISLFANDSEPGMHYLIAESFNLPDREVKLLKTHQLSGSLAKSLISLSKTNDDSLLKNLAHNDKTTLRRMIDRNPEYNEQNVAYLIHNRLHDHRVLVIYNCRRMIDFIDKRQLNPNASGEQGLLHKPEALAFHVDPLSRTPWLITLQDST
ncbi:zeta toxin family protein [Methylotuvimicrobium sp. KM2]|uniref:zeta toxin family protein n=1 Tax=Methylotuvimicrobium sp. KM2 TaxID=3133976 RepID=UPI003100A9E0